MKRTAWGSAILVLSIMVVNAGNYALNVVLANRLAPSVFGDASLMVSVLLITGVMAATLQLATSVAILKRPERRSAHLRSMRQMTNRLGWLVGFLLAIAAPVATAVLTIESQWALIVMALGLPLHLQLAVERGRLQGDLELGRLALTFLAEGAARVGATILALAVSPDVTTLAVALNVGFVGGYLLCRPKLGHWSWLDLSRPADLPPIASVGVAVVAVTLLTNVDVIAAKGVFDPATAGEFAALALGGRVVFFGSWTLQQAVLPLVVADHPTIGQQLRKRLFLVANAVVCSALVAIGWIWADLWVEVAFGSTYAQVASQFGPYALGTGLISVLAAAAVIRSTEGDDRPGRLMGLGAVAATAALFGSGESLDVFVDVRLLSLVALVGIVGIVDLLSQISDRFTQRDPMRCRSHTEGAFL